METLTLAPNEERSWSLVADVAKDHVQVEELRALLRTEDDLESRIESALETSTRELEHLLARADAFQCTRDRIHRAP